MANIPLLQRKNQFTQDLIDVVNITPPDATDFLMNMFRFVYKPTLYLSWQTRRFTEILATSVIRGTNGNRIKATGFTQKVELPPFFHLYFNMMQLEGFNAAFGTQNPTEGAFYDLMDEASFMYNEMKKMINRAKELMASQILQTGIVLDATTGNINFDRNPSSIMDLGSGGYWDGSISQNPFATGETMCTFLRQYGKVGGNRFRWLMGASAYRNFLLQTAVLSRAQKLWNVLTALEYPELKDDGSVYMGNISCGPYSVDIFTYPQYYTSSTEAQELVTVQAIAGQTTSAATSNTSTPYIADYNTVMVPEKMQQIHGCALVPALPKQIANDGDMTGEMGLIEGGKFFAYDYQDVKLTAWENNLKAAGMPILTRVDEVVTAKVCSA